MIEQLENILNQCDRVNFDYSGGTYSAVVEPLNYPVFSVSDSSLDVLLKEIEYKLEQIIR